MYLGQCLNPPCQVGGSIEVNGVAVELAGDVEVQGIGDNRILRRAGTTAWYSVYAIPADFIAAGATPESLYESWNTRLRSEWEAAQPAPGAVVTAAPGPLQAGFGGNTLLIVAGLGLAAAFLIPKRKGRRRVH